MEFWPLPPGDGTAVIHRDPFGDGTGKIDRGKTTATKTVKYGKPLHALLHNDPIPPDEQGGPGGFVGWCCHPKGFPGGVAITRHHT